MLIHWDASFATGIDYIDEQHKVLIEKYNEFYAVTMNGVDMQIAGEVLDFLQFYAAWHFSREEECMEEYRCPIAQTNKRSHAEFIERFTRFYEQWQLHTMDHELVLKTLNEFGRWIEGHIKRIDTQFYPCVHP